MRTALICRKLLLCTFLLLVFSILPIPVLSDIVHTTTVKASDIENDDDTKAKLNVNSKSLVLNDTYTLKVYRTSKNQKIIFKTDDSSIVSVRKTDDKEAVITANDIGDTEITVVVKDGSDTVSTLKCDITVTPPAVSIKLIITEKDNKVELKVGDKEILKSELKPATTSETPTFISSNSKVVTVSSKGVVTAVASGHATIYACIGNGTYDYCTVYVVE